MTELQQLFMCSAVIDVCFFILVVLRYFRLVRTIRKLREQVYWAKWLLGQREFAQLVDTVEWVDAQIIKASLNACLNDTVRYEMDWERRRKKDGCY